MKLLLLQQLKKGYENQLEMSKMLGKKSDSILDMLDVRDYNITTKITKTSTNADKTSLQDIENYMNSVKNNDKNKYEDYIELKKTTKNFFIIRKWFYTNFPNQKPKKIK